MVAVTGDNGAGKSTLLKAIAGLIKPLKGKVIKPKNSRIAYLSQQCDIDQTFPIDVKTLVRTGLWSFVDYGKTSALMSLRFRMRLKWLGSGTC